MIPLSHLQSLGREANLLSFHLGKSELFYFYHNLIFFFFLVATSMKIASVSYAFILGNICILEIRAHYAKHSLHAIMKLKKFRSID